MALPITIKTTAIDHVATGAAIRKRREDAGKTLQTVADSANLSVSYLGDLERGNRNWSVELVREIEKAIG
jgi:transcriptional regulator with XRE-family HTH domain